MWTEFHKRFDDDFGKKRIFGSGKGQDPGQSVGPTAVVTEFDDSNDSVPGRPGTSRNPSGGGYLSFIRHIATHYNTLQHP